MPQSLLGRETRGGGSRARWVGALANIRGKETPLRLLAPVPGWSREKTELEG